MSDTLNALRDRPVANWRDLNEILDELAAADAPADEAATPFRAVGFVTYEYGIDGVSMEIAKYATCLERLARHHRRTISVHCIAGEFTDDAVHVLHPEWPRHVVSDANGWAKWSDGVWFRRLFHEDLPKGSEASNEVARAIWKQGTRMALDLAGIVEREGIDLLFPINVNSNPGNPAFALATVLVSEVMGIPVVNSNHDFYWEGGAPPSSRAPGEEPGPRDHFFRNHKNKQFFRFLERLHPWNGRRWSQLVINDAQRTTLIKEYGIPSHRVRELGTFVEDAYFVPGTPQRRRELRVRLGYILGDGERAIRSESVDRFRSRIGFWMESQEPVVLGQEDELGFDVSGHHALWFLQPTRVVTRKRIERDWELIGSLFHYAPFRTMFEESTDLTLTLHVTGPVPIEHEDDLQSILDAYRKVLDDLSPAIARRVFQAFSAGKLGQSGFLQRGAVNLTVADLYHLADLALLPSQTEGRGLPILEAAAAGLPMVCSRYQPLEVYENVVGKGLPKKRRIRHFLFPEGRFDTGLLQGITDAVFMPEVLATEKLHNRIAVAERYGMRELIRTFEEIIEDVAAV